MAKYNMLFLIFLIGSSFPQINCLSVVGNEVSAEKEVPIAENAVEVETVAAKRSDKEADKSVAEKSKIASNDALDLIETLAKDESKRQNNDYDDTPSVSARSFNQFGNEPNPMCNRVSCSAPPLGVSCRISTSTSINPLIPALGSKSDCCPVHVCQRADGTHFTHYGLEGDDVSGKTSSYSQGTALNNFPTPHSLFPFPSMNFGPPPMGSFKFPQFFGGNNNNNNNDGQSFDNFPNLPNLPPLPALPPLMPMPWMYGSGNSNNNNNNRPYQATYPSWNNRDRRDLIPQPQYIRPAGPYEFLGPQDLQQAAFPYQR